MDHLDVRNVAEIGRSAFSMLTTVITLGAAVGRQFSGSTMELAWVAAEQSGERST